MKREQGFTLAEVLITLAIIGVVAAMTIPSVIINTNQQEFKTGLKKAVSVLNQAITMNMALESTNPGDMEDEDELLDFFRRRLNVIKTTTALDFGKGKNMAFYTTDGMRFELPGAITVTNPESGTTTFGAAECTGAAPCLIVVDVNGDKKPNPVTATSVDEYKRPNADDTRILDVFTLMITDTAVTPFGTVAQRTMFQNE